VASPYDWKVASRKHVQWCHWLIYIISLSFQLHLKPYVYSVSFIYSRFNMAAIRQGGSDGYPDASDMLEEALKQMDGLLAGKFSSLGSVFSLHFSVYLSAH